MITPRDIFVAVVAAGLTLSVVALANQEKPIMHSKVFDWNSMTAKQTEVGEVRSLFRTPTATLNELEIHVTTLKPGMASHPPHKHPNEELVIVKEGTLEALSGGEWKKLGPGSVMFNASNELHGVRNAGAGPATYHVINWNSPLTPKEESK
jgi:XRE family transcriptional regulator, regulator of sulfur utilization